MSYDGALEVQDYHELVDSLASQVTRIEAGNREM